MMARSCAYCTGPIPAEHPHATYCRNACRQRAYKERQRGQVRPRGVVHFNDVLHLLRFGVRLDVSVRQIATAVYGLTPAPDGMTALDVATLRRLVRTDQQRTTDDAMAARQDRRRDWRWAA